MMADGIEVKEPLADLPSGDLQAIQALEHNLGDKYYLIAYRKSDR